MFFQVITANSHTFVDNITGKLMACCYVSDVNQLHLFYIFSASKGTNFPLPQIARQTLNAFAGMGVSFMQTRYINLSSNKYVLDMIGCHLSVSSPSRIGDEQ